jgi:hypothetical protein
MKKPKLKTKQSPVAPKIIGDAGDIEQLLLDPQLGDGIVDAHFHSVPVGRPKDFFRTHPMAEYRRRGQLYTHKPEGSIEATHYLVGPGMRDRIDEAHECSLVTVVNREGQPRIWPIRHPRPGQSDLEAWSSARDAAKRAVTTWVRLVWKGRSFLIREALPGYAPDPVFEDLPEYHELLRLAFGDNNIIRDENHPIARELFGAPTRAGGDDDL